MKNLRKLIALSACGLSLFVLSGCGALTPKDMEGAYQMIRSLIISITREQLNCLIKIN